MKSKILPFMSLIIMGVFGVFSTILPLNLSALAGSFAGGLMIILYLKNGSELGSLGLLLGQTLTLFSLSLIAGINGAQNTIPFTGVFIALGFLLGLWLANNFKIWIKLVASTLLMASLIVQVVLFPSPQYLGLGIPLLVIGSMGLSLTRVFKW